MSNEILKTYLNAFADIQGMNPLRRVLKETELPSGRSWEEIEEALKPVAQQAIEPLRDLYEELRLFGRKHVYLLGNDSDLHKALLDVNSSVPQSEFSKSYPLPVSTNEKISLPVLSHIADLGDFRHFVFNSHREVVRREDLDSKWIKEDAPEDIRQAREIHVVHRKFEQAFDVIAVPKDLSRSIEIRVDLFNYNTDPRYEEILFNLRYKMRELAGATKVIDLVNLFPAIEKIYDDNKEGRISELAFMCPSSARRREVLMMKKADDDLREEVYHVAGKGAVGTIQIYRLAVDWWADDQNNQLHDAHLLLPGTLKMLNSTELYEARVPRMVRRREYEWIISRLHRHV
jgi:hypothetical protein